MTKFDFNTTGDEIVQAFSSEVSGKTFLITGPSEGGIGAETAISLARAHPKLLVLAGRSKSKIQPVIDQIEKISPETSLEFVDLDLSSLSAIRRALDAIKSLGVNIEVLINNAAIMACPFSKTTDGIEMQFGTNHIGPFLFTNLLLKEGIVTKGARIVNVNSSISVRKGSFISPHFDDLSYGDGKDYSPWTAYTVSKSAGVLYTRELAEMVKGQNITVLSLNPGSITSPLQRHLTPDMVQEAVAQAKASDPDWKFPEQKTVQEGCSTQLRAALDPSLVTAAGAYLDDCQPIEYPEHVEIYPYAKKVWRISEKLVDEDFSFGIPSTIRNPRPQS